MSISEYTPTTGALLEIYRGYRRRNRGLIGSAPPHRQIEDEFDRWLAQVKDEARREGQAEAWDEGEADGRHNAIEHRPGMKFTNPYRNEGTT